MSSSRILQKSPYDSDYLKGPSLGEIKKGCASQPDFSVVSFESGLRFRSILESDNSVITWFLNETDFWISMIPTSDTVLVQCFGWPQLWDAGYREETYTTFQVIQYDVLVKAIKSNPGNAPWFIDFIGNNSDGTTVYVGFNEYHYGPEPLFVGPSSYTSSVLQKLNEKFNL